MRGGSSGVLGNVSRVIVCRALRPHRTGFRSSNTVAYVERLIQTLQQECLDYFVVFGEQRLNHLVSEMVANYHTERPHQAEDNELLVVRDRKKRTKKSNDPTPIPGVGCRQRLGGLLKHYHRKAA